MSKIMLSADLQSSCVTAVAIALGTIHICAKYSSLQIPLKEAYTSIVRCFRLADNDDSKRLRHMMDEARTENFKSAMSALLINATLLVVFMLTYYFTVEPWQRPEYFQMVVVSLGLYALTIFGVHTRFEWTPARTKVCIAIMNFIVLLDWSLVQAPEVWVIQHSICFVWVIMMGIIEMDYRRSAFWCVVFCIQHTWKHLQMTASWATEHKTQAMVHYILEGLFAWTICFLSQVWFTDRCRGSLDVEASKTMLRHLLSVFCDAEVYIGSDCQIVGSHERFSNILTGGKPVQGTNFAEFLVATDQERFKVFIESAAESASNQSNSLPSALHVNMCSSEGHISTARIFHSAFAVSNEHPHHLLGICLDSPDPCAEAALDVAAESAEAPAEDSDQAGLYGEALKAADATHNENDSAATSSGFSTNQTDLKEVILSLDPFQPGFPIRNCSFNFCHREEPTESSLLPKISDWLKVHDFKRFTRWAHECVNKQTYGDLRRSMLKRFQMRIWGADLFADTVNCVVDCEDYVQPSSHSSFVSKEQIKDDAKTSTEGAEYPTTLQVRLNGIEGHNNLFRTISETLQRSSKRSHASSAHTRTSEKSRSSEHSQGSSVHLPKIPKLRQSLQTMQESLEGIVSSIFDASCVCDKSGQLVEYSPQFQETLHIAPHSELQDHPSPNLCELTASEGERLRLEGFLTSSLMSAQHQASKIQCSFQTAGGQVKACLYAIALPASNTAELEAKTLFIALQEQAAKVDVPRISRHTAVHQRGGFADQGAHDTQQMGAALDCTRPSSGGRQFDRVGSAHELLPANVSLPANNIDSELASLCSLAYSSSPTQPSCADPCNIDAGSQTDFPLSLQEAWTQTEFEVNTVTLASRTREQCGRPPRPAIEVDTTKRKLEGNKRQRRRGVTRPRSSKPFLSDHKGTPVSIVQLLLTETLLRVNPLANGCCFWHACVLYLQEAIQQMMSQKCSQKMPLKDVWQCKSCCVLEPEDSSECEICGMPRVDESCMSDANEDSLVVEGSDLADSSASWASGSQVDSD